MARATATILFTDVVGSTELRGRLGEEAADELRRRHDELLTRAVEGHGGRVVKGLGDGIMATFTGASDAVAAAVASQQAVDRLNRSGRRPLPLAVRVGLSAGDVTFEDGDVHGTPVIEAARLCGAAGGGEILLSDVVRILAGLDDHGVTDRGDLALKGLPKPVAAWAVGWERAAVSSIPVPPLLTDLGRIFVGRDAELDRLTQLWKEAAAGERRVALLAGEPGVGKTRLAGELARRVNAEGGVVLAGRCDEDLGVPYQPFVEALRHFVDHTPGAELTPRLGRYGGELGRLLPELAQRAPALAPPLQSDPDTERYRLFDAVAAWLDAASTDEPLLLILDDLQWAAKPTLLLLRHVVRFPELNRVLIVGTYRDTELGHAHPLVEVLADLRRQDGVGRLSVGGLDPSGVTAFMEQAAGHAAGEKELALARVIHEETEGNPFFVREILRHLAETGAVERHEGRWGTRLPVEELGIPESVREVVGRRLARLSERANDALRVAAVAGAEFDLRVVQAAGALDDEALVMSLEEAAQARLIIEESAQRYRFAHALVRDALYGELSAARRATLHRQVAQAVESVHSASVDDYLPALAHHWARASAPAAETGRAVDYAVRAGNRALAQLAHDEAVAYYRSAVELLDAAGDAAGSGRAELLISLGEAERRAGDPAYRATLLAAADLAREAGDADRLARAALANQRGIWSAAGSVDEDRVRILEAALEALGDDPKSTIRARLLAQLALELTFGPDQARKEALCREALEIARRDGSPATRARVIVGFVDAIRNPDTVEERMALTAELLTAAETAGDPALWFWGNLYRAIAATEVPDSAEARRCVDATIRLAEDLRQPTFGWLSRMLASMLAATAGRLDESERLALESSRLGQSTGQADAVVYFAANQFTIGFHRGRLGDVAAALDEALATAPDLVSMQGYAVVAYCETGREAEARRMFDGLLSRLPDLPKEVTWLRLTAQLAVACAHLNDVAGAAILHELMVPYQAQAASTGATWFGAVAHHLGLLAATLGRDAEAEERFAAAEQIHEDFGARPWTARTRLDWAGMLLARSQPGDVDHARKLLGQALATARELGLAAIERRAVELLS